MSNPPNRTPSKLAYEQSSQALQKRPQTAATAFDRHKAYLDTRSGALAKWVRAGVRPEALIRFALLDLQQNDKLRACTEVSIYAGLLACAVTGLEPGALKGEAYLVPFGGKAQFIAGYKGLIKQARRSREIVGLVGNVVREADAFDLDLGSGMVVHKPLLRGDRGDVIGSYAIATMAGGHREIEWVDRDELGRIRDVADKRGASAAWRDWPDEMSRKSSIRRLCKRLPLGADYYVGMAIEQAQDEGRDSQEVIDVIADGEGSKAQQSAADAESMRAQVSEITDDEAAEIARIEREQADR